MTLGKRWRGSFALISVLWLAQACATPIQNRPSPNAPPHSLQRNRASKDIFLALNLSGGGTRAAALAYGVFEELADTRIRVGGKERQLLDEVDLISSVSGGSFLAAWHGLHGMETIPSFAESFLYQDFQTPLVLRALSPANWGRGRGEVAARYYDGHLFHGATVGDFRPDGPSIVLNATDLIGGHPFAFGPDYFEAICSDLSAFPVAYAVTASSAVPGVFSPVVLENHSERCKRQPPPWIEDTMRRADRQGASTESERARVFAGYYGDTTRYIHLVDGGVTDNQGATLPLVREEEFGGVVPLWHALGNEQTRHAMVLVVNASVRVAPEKSSKRSPPSTTESLLDSSTVMVNRGSRGAIDRLRNSLAGWEQELARNGMPTRIEVVELSFETLAPDERDYFHSIPTALALDREQVDNLREVGRRLLREHPAFQELVEAYGGSPKP